MGLKELKAKSLDPDLILCDIMMPEMDGYTVAYTLKQSPDTAEIPFLFLTAKAEKMDIRKGMELGADDYLTKPYSSLELLSAIETRIKKVNTVEKLGSNSFDLQFRDGELLKNLKIVIDEYGLKPKKFKKKELLYTEAANPIQIYLVHSGVIKIYTPINGDRDFISHFVLKDELLGLEELMLGEPFSNYAMALVDTMVYPISKDLWMKTIKSNPALMLNIVKRQRDKKVYIESKLALNAFKSVRKRVASALLELQVIFTMHAKSDFIHISREDLANFVGVSPETVIRALSEFKKQKQIVIESGKIKVVDSDFLKNIRN